jgi:phage terminase large subunit-like protein
MPTRASRQRFSTSERKLWAEIDAAVEGWCVEGLVERSDWPGRPLIVTPLPADVTFDVVAVRNVLEFFGLLRQTKGQWAGKPFRLFDWQVRYELAPIFGLKRADGLRAVRTAWIEKPRKNGKSTECSAIGLYLWCADREPGAEVYAAAGDRLQAGIVFGQARQMAEGSETIVESVGLRALQRARLEHPRTHAIFRALSSDGARQHGLNVHGGIVDEVHVHKNPDLIDALETGTGSREQPLIVFITTADDGDDSSVYATKREYLEGIAAGTITDPSFYGVVFGVDDRAAGFDPFADATLHAANPGAGKTVTWDYLRKAAASARQSPSELNRYLRLHLGIRTKQTTRWLTLQAWDAAAGLADAERWEGRTAFAGLDLSTTTDLTSFQMVLPYEPGVEVWPMFWLPEMCLPMIAIR